MVNEQIADLIYNATGGAFMEGPRYSSIPYNGDEHQRDLILSIANEILMPIVDEEIGRIIGYGLTSTAGAIVDAMNLCDQGAPEAAEQDHRFTVDVTIRAQDRDQASQRLGEALFETLGIVEWTTARDT